MRDREEKEKENHKGEPREKMKGPHLRAIDLHVVSGKVDQALLLLQVHVSEGVLAHAEQEEDLGGELSCSADAVLVNVAGVIELALKVAAHNTALDHRVERQGARKREQRKKPVVESAPKVAQGDGRELVRVLQKAVSAGWGREARKGERVIAWGQGKSGRGLWARGQGRRVVRSS